MRAFLALALAAAPLLAMADAGAALSQRLAQLSALSGRFEQLQYNPQGQLTGETRGEFRILIPGYFAWDIQSPDSQLLIADLQYLWHYDRDLETVTRRPVGGRERATPLQVLGGSPDELRRQFSIDAGERPDTFVLVPKSEGQGFQALTLLFETDQLQAMEVLDSLGQRISIRFTALDHSPLDAADFQFEPPADADLFVYDE